MVELPPLRVADDYVTRARVAKHVGRDLARVRAVLRLGGTVLARDAYVRAFETVGHGLYRREDRRYHDLAVVRVRNQRLQLDRRPNRVGDQLVHLPVPRDNRLSTHSESFRYLSFKAATPGSSSPARNSSVAPPPVEMCVILSATPAL